MNVDLSHPSLQRVRAFLQSVQSGVGHPEDPRQDGTGGFFPGLTARPWHDADDFASTRRVTEVLERAAGAIIAEYTACIGSCQHLRNGATGLRLARIQHHKGLCQPRHFVRRMGDVQHGNLELVAQALQPWQYVLAPRCVQR